MAKLQEIKRQRTPFLIELPAELNARLREQKPKHLSLRRFIIVLLTNHPATQLYKNRA